MNEPRIITQKTGGLWHGLLEGDRTVDETALTEEMARKKVERILERRRTEGVESRA